jgi:hypothetical protein
MHCRMLVSTSFLQNQTKNKRSIVYSSSMQHLHSANTVIGVQIDASAYMNTCKARCRVVFVLSSRALASISYTTINGGVSNAALRHALQGTSASALKLLQNARATATTQPTQINIYCQLKQYQIQYLAVSLLLDCICQYIVGCIATSAAVMS